MQRGTIIAGAGVVLAALVGGAAVYGLGPEPRPGTGSVSLLKSNNLGQVRREALSLFPPGSPVAKAGDGLKALGFNCAPARHMLANINAPTVQCDSAGRGYPTVSRLQMTVIARNGMVSDIAVGNGFDSVQADAQTPNPVSSFDTVAAGNGHDGAEKSKKGSAEHGEKAPAEHSEKAPVEHGEKASAEHGEKASAEHGEKAPAEHGEKAAAEHGGTGAVEKDKPAAGHG